MPADLLPGLGSPHLSAGSPEPRLRPGRPTLFSMRYCPFAQRAMLVAARKGIDLDIVNVHLISKPEWLFAKNPLGLVPCIQDGDFVAFDSAVIVSYLEEKFPEPSLRPESPEARAVDGSFLVAFGSKMSGIFKAFLMTKDPEESKRRSLAMLDALEWMEGELEGRGGRTFFADGQVGMLDYCVYPWFDSLAAVERMGIIEVPWEERFPKLRRWFAETMYADPAVRLVGTDPQVKARVYRGYREGNVVYDFPASE